MEVGNIRNRYEELERVCEGIIREFLSNAPIMGWKVLMSQVNFGGVMYNWEHVTVYVDSRDILCVNHYNGDKYECKSDFEYGELLSIVASLPSKERMAELRDLYEFIIPNYDVSAVLDEIGFEYNACKVVDVECVDGGLLYHFSDGETCLITDGNEIRCVIGRMKLQIFKNSEQYKQVMDFLALEENMSVDFPSTELPTFKMDGKEYKITSVSRDDRMLYVHYGEDVGAHINMRPQYLDGVVSWFMNRVDGMIKNTVDKLLSNLCGMKDELVGEVIAEEGLYGFNEGNIRTALGNAIVKKMGEME